MMRAFKCFSVLVLFSLFATGMLAQKPGDRPDQPSSKVPAATGDKVSQKPPAKEEPPEEKKSNEPAPIVTHHEIRVDSKVLKYAVTAGRLPIQNADGEVEAYMFFMAYTVDPSGLGANPRPLMFSFNGGPGSSSVWLHLGALGPKRVKMQPEGYMPTPPFTLVDNEFTWLDKTDLVFIDPVGTGYSRPVKKELGQKFWNVQGDIDSIGEFIRLYLTRYERWNSPLFMVGESYGTFRAAGLAGHLIEKGIAFNGVLLVSTFMNFETLNTSRGNENGYILFLPTFTATAWYHRKLAPDLQKDLRATLREVEQWALTDYAAALAKGDQLTGAERQNVIDRLARYTGLSKTYIDNSNMRIQQPQFCAELLRDQKRVVGRLDSRFTGQPLSGMAEMSMEDPSMAAIRPPYTATFNNYIRQELGYKSDQPYYILGGGISGWGTVGMQSTDNELRSAFIKNPYMKLFVAAGYYDMATPYFGAKFSLDHLGLDPPLRSNITTTYYEAGHMMYIQNESLAKLKQDVFKFLESATGGN
jgi:carboxypeptidase C (cathepsin A)